MREIKFRAWDKLRKEMLDVYEISFDVEQVAAFSKERNKTVRMNPLDHDFDLMQFTGLHDGNGKEIWEGDVISDGIFKEGVEWDDEGFWRTTDVDAKKPVESMLCFFEINRFSIIGNIYENPELLK